MEEIPNNRSSKYDHGHGVNSQRMFRLNEILVNYPIKNNENYAKKESELDDNLTSNRLNNLRSIYKIAIKVGFISGLLVGSIIWIVFLIINR